MKTALIHEVIGDTDIYLVDQILKGRYDDKDLVLDAGCGSGRNMHWFLQNSVCIYGVDMDAACILDLKQENPTLPPMRLQVTRLNFLPFGDQFFHHIISSAVLHFAESAGHFFTMLTELVRVLKTNGTLFIRMTSDIGIEHLVKEINDGVYDLPDDTTRFLLTRPVLKNILLKYPLALIEPFKTVNVTDQRSMSVLMLQKTP